MAAANPARTNPTLVDTKGLGKPPPLTNRESEFVSWARRTENLVVSVHPGARDVLTWAVERESATMAEANAATEVVMPLDTLRMHQLYTVLMTLVEGESFNILVGSGEGLEAWRRLHKRWDPLTTGRARGLLRTVTVGYVSKVERRTGHQYKDCWVNLGRWPQSQGHSNSPGKGSDAKGKPG